MFNKKMSPAQITESCNIENCFISFNDFLHDETIKKYADQEQYKKSKIDILTLMLKQRNKK
jgi:hypothetical protein